MWSLLVLEIVVFVLFYIFLIDLIVIGHDFATTGPAINRLAEIIERHGKQDGIFFDLGSSRGVLVFRLQSRCLQLTSTGVDGSAFRIFLSRIMFLWPGRRATFLKADVLDVDISRADVVYMYLGTWMMAGLEEKLRHEMKPGAIAVTNTQFLPTWEPAQTVIVHPEKPEFEKMFVYIQT